MQIFVFRRSLLAPFLSINVTPIEMLPEGVAIVDFPYEYAMGYDSSTYEGREHVFVVV